MTRVSGGGVGARNGEDTTTVHEAGPVVPDGVLGLWVCVCVWGTWWLCPSDVVKETVLTPVYLP